MKNSLYGSEKPRFANLPLKLLANAWIAVSVTFLESAKLHALRAPVLVCLICSRANSRAKVPCVVMCQLALRAYVLMCQPALCAYMLMWQHNLHAYALTYQRALCALMFSC